MSASECGRSTASPMLAVGSSWTQPGYLTDLTNRPNHNAVKLGLHGCSLYGWLELVGVNLKRIHGCRIWCLRGCWRRWSRRGLSMG